MPIPVNQPRTPDVPQSSRNDEAFVYSNPPSPFVARAWQRSAAAREMRDRETLEIMISWGNSVLSVVHMTPPRQFLLGDIDAVQSSEDAPIDLRLPRKLLTHEIFPLMTHQADRLGLVVPAEATGWVEIPSEEETREAFAFSSAPKNMRLLKLGLQEAAALGEPSLAVPGATHLVLPFGSRLTMQVLGLTIRVELTDEVKLPRVGTGFDWNMVSYFAVSLGTFGSLLGGLAYFVPPLGLQDDDALDKSRRMLLSQYLNAAAERERTTEEEVMREAPEAGGVEAAAAPGKSGALGAPREEVNPARIAIPGPQRNRPTILSHAETQALATDFGIIGLLNPGPSFDAHALGNPFSRDSSLGSDDMSAHGDMWSDSIFDVAGHGGLFATGRRTGGDGGKNNVGIGIQGVRTGIDHTGHCDPATGVHCGMGDEGFSSGRAGGPGHATAAPRIRVSTPTTSGRLPREVVQRVVRQNFGRFRMCYERGLRENPSLEGRVAVRFVIGNDGSVSNASAVSGGMPDAKVSSCVAEAFYGLSFPAPEAGVVKVTYPLMFSPGL